jgi:hypothetical protein
LPIMLPPPPLSLFFAPLFSMLILLLLSFFPSFCSAYPTTTHTLLLSLFSITLPHMSLFIFLPYLSPPPPTYTLSLFPLFALIVLPHIHIISLSFFFTLFLFLSYFHTHTFPLSIFCPINSGTHSLLLSNPFIFFCFMLPHTDLLSFTNTKKKTKRKKKTYLK